MASPVSHSPAEASQHGGGTSGGFRGWLNACLWTQKKIPGSVGLCFYCPVFDRFPILITNVPQACCQAEGLSQVARETVGATEPWQQSHQRQANRSQAKQSDHRLSNKALRKGLLPNHAVQGAGSAACAHRGLAGPVHPWLTLRCGSRASVTNMLHPRG